MTVIRIGARGSKLAQIQVRIVAEKLTALDPTIHIEKVVISTAGDQDKETPLVDMGGKGVFIKALEHALLDNTIDMAVHSAKDMTSSLHPDLQLSAVLEAESAADAWVFLKEEEIGRPNIATSSLRRMALIRHLYPNCDLIPIRGNVETRIKIAKDKGYDALLLSEAGLQRLDIDIQRKVLDPLSFTPAPGQGVIAIETKKECGFIDLVSGINHPTQWEKFGYERYIMEKIGFDCHIPLGLYCHESTDKWTMICFASKPSGNDVLKKEIPIERGKFQCLDPLIQELRGWFYDKASD